MHFLAVPKLRWLGAGDIGLCGGNHNVDARSSNMQGIDRHRPACSTRRTRLLVDDDADSAGQRNRKVWIGNQDRLACNRQSNQFGIPANTGLSIATGGAGVGFHGGGSNQAIQQIYILERRLRLTARAAPRGGTAERVRRSYTRDVDAGNRSAQVPAA